MEVVGIASTVARLKINHGGTMVDIASWRMEFGDNLSPGAFLPCSDTRCHQEASGPKGQNRRCVQEVAPLVASSKAADPSTDTDARVGVHTRRNISGPLGSAPRLWRVRGRQVARIAAAPLCKLLRVAKKERRDIGVGVAGRGYQTRKASPGHVPVPVGRTVNLTNPIAHGCGAVQRLAAALQGVVMCPTGNPVGAF